MARLRVPEPLPVDWDMKDVSTAEVFEKEMDDGRVEFRVRHEIILGVTPTMLVWWLQNFHGIMEYRGSIIPMYRILHPKDHIRVRILKPAPDGSPGFSKGAFVEICERILVPAQVLARVVHMDETGVHLTVEKGLGKIADLWHAFTGTPDGTLVQSRLLIGSSAPVIGGLLNEVLNRRMIALKLGRAWVKHNVEEVGNFQYFLPGLYRKQADAA